MEVTDLNLDVSRLGPCRIPSPMSRVQFVEDEARVLYHSHLEKVEALLAAGKRLPCFEMAGPREKIYFDSSKTERRDPSHRPEPVSSLRRQHGVRLPVRLRGVIPQIQARTSGIEPGCGD